MESEGKAGTAKPVVVLFRHDLRLADNLALSAARETGKQIVAAYVRDDEVSGARPLGAARLWWLHQSLEALAADLRSLDVRLVLRKGEMRSVALSLCEETGADTVLWNRRFDRPGTEADTAMKSALSEAGMDCRSFDGFLLHQPWSLKTGAGGPFKVYTPFWRALIAQDEPRKPLPAPKSLKPFEGTVTSETLSDWSLLPRDPDWAGGIAAEWTPGEAGAKKRLTEFLDGPISGYGENRDVPGMRSTSRLSPHLAHGEISPFQIWAAVRAAAGAPAGDTEKYLKELAWREFSWHLLFHNPDLATKNFNERFDAFEWNNDPVLLRRWQKGETGYPIVDAGMRELWKTGWMHNRVRMVVASFLVKHLLIDWREGERWFWDTLVDADPGNNAASWQWVAGTGADAAPYFRVFNPILQGDRFDGEGHYVREHVPELARLPDKFLHRPWEADPDTLSTAGVKLGETYPVAVVDHQASRDRALEAYQNTRGD